MSEFGADLALGLYRGVGRLATPLLALLLERRRRAGKEDGARRGERWGIAGLARPAGPLVWIHAASVGECVAVIGLAHRLIAEGVGVLMTTGTVTSAEVAARRLPPGAIHQYVPLDVSTCVGRFLDHWRPDLAICVESEIWPATVGELARRRIPQVLVNARVSARSARRWRLLDGVAGALFGRLALTLAQTPGDAERLAGLGADPVIVTGNLKFDGAVLPVDETERARLAAAIGDRPAWIAASTHPGEEAVAAEVHARLAARTPRLLTVIAPRHPERGDEIRAMLDGAHLSHASRSRGETPGPETAVYLADTIGEMGLVYRLAPIAFVGGSLVPRGGQNPIEPALLDVAVLHGPAVENFRDVYRLLDDCGGARVITGADDLSAAVGGLLGDADARRRTAAHARATVEASAGALGRTLAALVPLLPTAEPEAAR